MGERTTRVMNALSHQATDRTPLCENFQRYHPIHWPVCGHTIATDEAMCWDARADGVAWEELLEAEVRAAFQINRFFDMDMVRLHGAPRRDYKRPVKIGKASWTLDGVEYVLNERTKLVELANPAATDAYSHHMTEEKVRAQIEAWDGRMKEIPSEPDLLYARVRAMAEAEGLDWVYMGEAGAGTGVAFYPDFMLMWMLAEPELYERWLAMQKASVFPWTRSLIRQGHPVIAMGGDVSCDKGPFISPDLYHRYLLPAIREHVRIIHEEGATAVYTSDGNHWPIKEDFFFNSGIDGYLEVDKAAGMTMERLIAEGVADRVCIIGNLDARHMLCHGRPDEVRVEVRECLRLGRQCRGGHILHASHSVHEDVKAENYLTAVNTYREYFGLPLLAW